MSKIRIIIISCIFIMLVLTGCSNNKTYINIYTFRGENTEWKAVYIVYGEITKTENHGVLDYDRNSRSKLVVTYKGSLSDLSTVKHLEIAYEAGTSGGKITTNVTEGSISSKTFTMMSGGNSFFKPDKNEVVPITVKLDGVKQTFDLNMMRGSNIDIFMFYRECHRRPILFYRKTI